MSHGNSHYVPNSEFRRHWLLLMLDGTWWIGMNWIEDKGTSKKETWANWTYFILGLTKFHFHQHLKYSFLKLCSAKLILIPRLYDMDFNLDKYDMPEFKFRVKQIEKILQKIYANKSPGLDVISEIAMKNCASRLILPKFFYESRIFRKVCKTVWIQLVPNEGWKSLSAKYSILILSMPSNVM